MRSVTNGLAEGLSFNLPKSWARIPERTELCNEENQAIAATLIARFQNPASHRFVLLGWGWGWGCGAEGWGPGVSLASSCPTCTGYDPPASLPLGPQPTIHTAAQIKHTLTKLNFELLKSEGH